MSKIPLKALRETQRISQKDLATILDVSQQTVASWEVGRTEPSNGKLSSLADIFDVSVDYLLGREKSPAKSAEETNLLAGYRRLPPENRTLILNLVGQLNK